MEVWSWGRDAVTFSPSVVVDDGQSDVGGASGVVEVDTGVTGGVLGEGGEGAAGSQVASEGFTESEVSDESESAEEGGNRGRERGGQGKGERATDAHQMRF